MDSYRVISSDDHVFEPPDLWTSQVESKFKGREPRIVRDDDGNDWWYCDGHSMLSAGGGSQTGMRFEEPEKLSRADKFENVRPGGYIPEEHIKDMDIDGLDVSILYPTVGLQLYSVVPDSDLLTSLFRNYNDWLSEFCSAYPSRLKGIAMVNVDVVEDGIKELERCAKMGFAGAMITVYPPDHRSYNLPEYESLWAAAQDIDIPLSLHITTARPGPGQDFANVHTVNASFMINIDHWVRMSLSNMILSGVFERYPKLQAGSIEMELSWVPHFLDRMDYNYTQRFPEQAPYRYKEDMLPSDYFHRNVFLGFQEDALGIELRHIIGVDSLLWGSDYPHPESTWPRSRQILEEILAQCSEEEKAKIAGGNAARIYRLE